MPIGGDPQAVASLESSKLFSTNPVPKIECGIDMWSTGEHRKREFNEAEYGGAYKKHIKQLEEWAAIDPTKTRKLHVKWYGDIR